MGKGEILLRKFSMEWEKNFIPDDVKKKEREGKNKGREHG